MIGGTAEEPGPTSWQQKTASIASATGLEQNSLCRDPIKRLDPSDDASDTWI